MTYAMGKQLAFCKQHMLKHDCSMQNVTNVVLFTTNNSELPHAALNEVFKTNTSSSWTTCAIMCHHLPWCTIVNHHEPSCTFMCLHVPSCTIIVRVNKTETVKNRLVRRTQPMRLRKTDCGDSVGIIMQAYLKHILMRIQICIPFGSPSK